MNDLTLSIPGPVPNVVETPNRYLTPTVAPVASLAKAISGVMAEINVVVKGGFNKFHQYNYARMEDILHELTPLMGKHGLMVMQTETSRAMFDEDRVIAVTYQFTIAHLSGEIWPERIVQTGMSPCRHRDGKFDDKAMNKCHTAARKYFLLALFQVPTGDADDADAGGGERPARQIDRDRAPPVETAEPVNDEPAKFAGREAAHQGGAAYKTWAEGLTREQRARLKPWMGTELVPIFRAVDAAATAAAAKAPAAENNAPAGSAPAAGAKPSPPRPVARVPSEEPHVSEAEAAQTDTDMI